MDSLEGEHLAVGTMNPQKCPSVLFNKLLPGWGIVRKYGTRNTHTQLVTDAEDAPLRPK